MNISRFDLPENPLISSPASLRQQFNLVKASRPVRLHAAERNQLRIARKINLIFTVNIACRLVPFKEQSAAAVVVPVRPGRCGGRSAG